MTKTGTKIGRLLPSFRTILDQSPIQIKTPLIQTLQTTGIKLPTARLTGGVPVTVGVTATPFAKEANVFVTTAGTFTVEAPRDNRHPRLFAASDSGGGNSDGSDRTAAAERELKSQFQVLDGHMRAWRNFARSRIPPQERLAAIEPYINKAETIVRRLLAAYEITGIERSAEILHLMMCVARGEPATRFRDGIEYNLTKALKRSGIISEDNRWVGLSTEQIRQFNSFLLSGSDVVIPLLQPMLSSGRIVSGEDFLGLMALAKRFEPMSDESKSFFFHFYRHTRGAVGAGQYQGYHVFNFPSNATVEKLSMALDAFESRMRPEELRQRLETLRQDPPIPFWKPVSLAVIEAELDDMESRDTTPRELLEIGMAITAIEWVSTQEKLSSPTKKGDTLSWQLEGTLAAFGRTLSTSDLKEGRWHEMGKVVAISFARYLSYESPFLQAVLSPILSHALSHPHWQVRYAAVRALRVTAQNLPRDMKDWVKVGLAQSAKDRSWRVQVEAKTTLATIAPRITNRQLIDRLGLGDHAVRLARSTSREARKAAFEFADAVWSEMSLQERDAFEATATPKMGSQDHDARGAMAPYRVKYDTGIMERHLQHLIKQWDNLGHATKRMIAEAPSVIEAIANPRNRRLANLPTFLKLFSAVATERSLEALRLRLWPSDKVRNDRGLVYPDINSGNVGFLSRIGLGIWPKGERVQVMMDVIAMMTRPRNVEWKSFLTSLETFMGGATHQERGAVREQIEERMDEITQTLAEASSYDNPLVAAIYDYLGALRSETREALIDERFYLRRALLRLSNVFPSWQTKKTLQLFLRASPFVKQALQKVIDTSDLPRTHYRILMKTIFQQFLAKGGQKELSRHLIAKAGSRGALEQVVNFYRLFNDLPEEVRNAFERYVKRMTRKTLVGLPDHKRAKYPKGHLLLNPRKAVKHLRKFLVKRFIDGLGVSGLKLLFVRDHLESHAATWEAGRLLQNLTTMQSFSAERGRAAIAEFVVSATSASAEESSKSGGWVRIFNPRRYEGLSGIFSGDFLDRWGNGDKDYAIPLGILDPQRAVAEDPKALIRSHYSFTLQQMGNHMSIPGVSHLSYAELVRAIKMHIHRFQSGEEGVVSWKEQFDGLIDNMGRLERIAPKDVEPVIEFARTHADSLNGSFSHEVVNDLVELSRNLDASAIEGTAWLVITSDPAAFLEAGHSPIVTCQDPRRRTGLNDQGQPIYRARDGRFRVAKVVIDDHLQVSNGVIRYSDDARTVARTFLEVTTDDGLANTTDRPHLLVERLYAAGGFVYRQLLETELRKFADGELKIDPDKDVHVVFGKKGNPPRHLPDNNPVYRDTFR